jgi:predicted nucleotidyltransferase
MGKIEFPKDFKDFLKLLNSYNAEYLLVGGYAVGYHGYPRATGDMDIWIAVNKTNAAKMFKVMRDFGIPEEMLTKELFLEKNKIFRIGVPPIRIEVITGVSGIDFDDSFKRRETINIDGIDINFICLSDLKINKKAAGRHKDIDDLEHLP